MTTRKQQMADKEIVNQVDPATVNVLVAVGLALIGGIVKYLTEMRKQGTWREKLKIFAIDLLVSGFVGLLAAALLTGLGANDWLVKFAGGYSGYLGGRSFWIARNFLKTQGLIK